jgi:hypothetical protein
MHAMYCALCIGSLFDDDVIGCNHLFVDVLLLRLDVLCLVDSHR